MIAPVYRRFRAHHQNILCNTIESGVGTGPDIVEEGKGADVELSLNGKFTQ